MSLIKKLIPVDRRPDPLSSALLEFAAKITFFLSRDLILNPDLPDIEWPIIEAQPGIPVCKNPGVRELALMEERVRFLHLEATGYPLPHAIVINAFAEVVRYKMLNAAPLKAPEDVSFGFTTQNPKDGGVVIEFHFPVPRLGFYARTLKAKIGAVSLAAWLKVAPAKIKKSEDESP